MRKLIFIIFCAILLGVAFYVYWYYYNTYSIGSRQGVLQKFSRKGNVFKTHEGELIQLGFGTRGGSLIANYFYFSVTDEALADTLSKCQGQEVMLHYRQYRRALPWRGDDYKQKNESPGQYIVDGIEWARPRD